MDIVAGFCLGCILGLAFYHIATVVGRAIFKGGPAS